MDPESLCSKGPQVPLSLVRRSKLPKVRWSERPETRGTRSICRPEDLLLALELDASSGPKLVSAGEAGHLAQLLGIAPAKPRGTASLAIVNPGFRRPERPPWKLVNFPGHVTSHLGDFLPCHSSQPVHYPILIVCQDTLLIG